MVRQFAAAPGARIVVEGLQFAGAECILSFDQEKILMDVFWSIDQLLNDPVSATRYKTVKFEVRGYSTFADNEKENRGLSENCANVVAYDLMRTGIPASHLQIKPMGSKGFGALGPPNRQGDRLRVEFVRIK